MAYNSTNEYLKLLNKLQAYHVPKNIVNSLSGYLKPIYKQELENQFSAPMFWIGLYIAAASLVCVVAMAADLSHSFRRKKLWFPCKYFRVNSAFLTVIGVAMKLPVDLTGSMPGTVDQVAKLGSMAFMCTMMANLLPCLATMDNSALVSNIVALCLLVITLVVNVCIQIQTGVVSMSTYNQDPRITALVSPRRYGIPFSKNYTILLFIYVTLLLVLLIIHVCSSLAILKSKQIIESKYQQSHYRSLQNIQPSLGNLIRVESLYNHVENSWIMARSGNPQFVTACLCTTSASGLICVLVAILHILTISLTVKAMLATDYDSDYSWSMIVIVIVQFIGVVIGTIAPLSRCFAIFINFEFTSFNISDHFKVLKVESYWTHKLYDCKSASLRLPYYRCNLEVVVKLLCSVCIGFQKGVVVVCKIIALIPFVCVLYYFYCLKWFKSVGFTEAISYPRFHSYFLQLEDEKEPAGRTIEGFLTSVHQLIEKGENSRANINLIKLIELKHDTMSFHEALADLDSVEIFRHPEDIRWRFLDSWMLSVVTLTTIVLSLSDVKKNKVKRLLKSVREGLKYVRLVEETFNVTSDYVRVQKAAETLWQEVEVYYKWLGNELSHPSSQVNTPKQIVEWFGDAARNILLHERITRHSIARGDNDDSIHKLICANSMYCVTRSIMSYDYNDGMMDTQQKLFNSLSSTIGDIIGDCLTNLPQVIITKCHKSVVEKREAGIKRAALLLGETKHIILALHYKSIPLMHPNDLPFIDKWRAYGRDLARIV